MDNRISNLIQTISLIALIGGIVLVFVEIKQSNEIASAQVQLSIFLRQIETNTMVLSEETGIAKFQSKLRSTPYEELSNVERERLFALTASKFNLWLSIQIQHDLDLVSRERLESWKNEITYFGLRFPAAVQTLVNFYNETPIAHDNEIFQPIRDYIAGSRQKSVAHTLNEN